MSIQAGWNSLLGMYGGISALQKGNELQEYNQVKEFKKGIHEAMGDVPETLTDIYTKFGSGEISREDLDRKVGEIEKANEEASKKYKNEIYFEGLPRNMKKAYEKAVKSELKYAQDTAVKRLRQNMATRGAQMAAEEADAAPKNTMQGAMEALMKRKQEGYGNIMGGGDYNG